MRLELGAISRFASRRVQHNRRYSRARGSRATRTEAGGNAGSVGDPGAAERGDHSSGHTRVIEPNCAGMARQPEDDAFENAPNADQNEGGMTHAQLVEALRAVDGLVDVGGDPPNFHFGARPFLHFHTIEEGVYADVRFGADFEPVWAASPRERQELLARVWEHIEQRQSSRKSKRARERSRERDR
jgi:hypothetical protein